LRPARLAEWVGQLLKHGGKNGRPLSAKSVYHAFTLLNGALRFALRMELIGRNPCDAATRPRVLRSDAKALTNEESIKLLNVARGSRWEAFIILALSTGARRGELCALSWNDFDAEANALTIRHSLSQTRRGIILKETKTGRSRSVPLSRIANDALRSQRALQAKERLANGVLYQNLDGAIFADEIGRRVSPMAASCAFERIARKASISTTRLHDLRHTAATTLIHAGVDIRTTASVLGHASPTVTLSIYAHLMADAQRDAVDRLGERLERLASNLDRGAPR
jgi:integrase